MNKINIDKYALFGSSISHSKSPIVYKCFSKELGINIDYHLIDVPNSIFHEKFNEFFQCSSSKGANITVPYKETVVSYCDILTNRAKLSRAVNVIKKLKNGVLLGDNTDGLGLFVDLKKKILLKKKKKFCC